MEANLLRTEQYYYNALGPEVATYVAEAGLEDLACLAGEAASSDDGWESAEDYAEEIEDSEQGNGNGMA